jgi:DnaJ-class molecular chaperone
MRMPGVSAIMRAKIAGRASLPQILCESRQWGDVKGGQMSAMTQKIQKIKEHRCAACNGTGFPVVKQPVLATRKIYPVKCEACAGKGRITDTD